MCGIVGVFGNWLIKDDIQIFNDLMLVSNLRGWEGSGVISVSREKQKINFVKSLGSGLDLTQSDEYREMIATERPSILVGHTRWPTKGEVNFDNTHPHEAGHITGVHNGTLEKVAGRWVQKDESDSFLLYQAIAEKGIEEAIRETKGAYALVWVDEDEGTLNFLRNDKRTLYMVANEFENTVFFASEYGMLQFVLGRYGKKTTKIEILPKDLHLKFKLDLKSGKIVAISKEIVKPEEVVVQQHHPLARGVMQTSIKNGGTIGSIKPKEENKSNVVPLLGKSVGGSSALDVSVSSLDKVKGGDLVAEYKARKQEREAKNVQEETAGEDYIETKPGWSFRRGYISTILDHGCANCGGISLMKDIKKLNWITSQEYTCAECADTEFVKEYMGLYGQNLH